MYNKIDVFPNEKGNWNHDIFIRDLKKEDLYDGITVQSYGNTNRIYELKCWDNIWHYRPISHIEDRLYGKLDSKLTEKVEWNDPYLRLGWIPQQGNEQWSETFYSIKMNKIHKRDNILNELLNEI